LEIDILAGAPAKKPRKMSKTLCLIEQKMRKAIL
jgi:hypothetical protein